MDELIRYIWKLRNQEGIPLTFRRSWLNNSNKAIWYIWYGYTLIAYRTDQEAATRAVDIAASVHRAIYESKAKAA